MQLFRHGTVVCGDNLVHRQNNWDRFAQNTVSPKISPTGRESDIVQLVVRHLASSEIVRSPASFVGFCPFYPTL